MSKMTAMWPGDAIWGHRSGPGSGSTLVQVMACCLMAPSYYLNQHWFLISEVLWYSQWVTNLPFSIMSFKIILLKLLLHLPGANELTKSVISHLDNDLLLIWGAWSLYFAVDPTFVPKSWLVQLITWSNENFSMMTSSNGNTFRVTGPLWGESTGHRWIPLTKASDAELWCFPWSAPEQMIE